MPRERLAMLQRARGREERPGDDLHKATQEARLTEEVRRPHRAATALLSARGRARCIMCSGTGATYSEPDICGESWLEDCASCGGEGTVVTR